MSYLDAYFNADKPKKRKSKKYITIGGRRYQAVGRKKSRRPKAADINSSGYFGMYTQPSRSSRSSGGMFGYGGSERTGRETVQNAKAMYSAGKNIYSAGRQGFTLGKAIYGMAKKKDTAYEVTHGDKGGMEFTEKFRSYRHAKAAEQKYKLKGKKTNLRTLLRG